MTEIRSTPERRWNLAAVTAAMLATALIYGLSVPLLALTLDARGVSARSIGVSTAVQSIAVVLAAPLLPALLVRHGPALTMQAATLVTLLTLLLLAYVESLAVYNVLRFIIGAAGCCLWVSGEAWVNQVARPETRGRSVALYGMAVQTGLACGPLVLAITGSAGRLPFVAAGVILLAATLPLMLVRHIAPKLAGEQRGSFTGSFRRAPLAMLCCAFVATADGILLAFTPLYGLRLGLPESGSLSLLAVMGIGGIVGQLPVGWLADRVDRRALAALLACALAVLAALMPTLLPQPGVNVLYMACLGAVLSGLYTLALVIIGQTYQGAELAAASALFGMMWGSGSIAGPPVGGIAMDLARDGMPWSIAALFCIFTVASTQTLLLRGGRTPSRP